MAALKTEMEPGESQEKLLAQVNDALARAEERIRSIDPTTLAEPRAVGRQHLPTTVIGLLVPAGWLTTGCLGADEFEPVPVASLGACFAHGRLRSG